MEFFLQRRFEEHSCKASDSQAVFNIWQLFFYTIFTHNPIQNTLKTSTYTRDDVAFLSIAKLSAYANRVCFKTQMKITERSQQIRTLMVSNATSELALTLKSFLSLQDQLYFREGIGVTGSPQINPTRAFITVPQFILSFSHGFGPRLLKQSELSTIAQENAHPLLQSPSNYCPGFLLQIHTPTSKKKRKKET